MGGQVQQGPICVTRPGHAIDEGTNCLQRTSPQGPTRGNGQVGYNLPLVLVGKMPRDPGKDENGDVFEDAIDGDAPAKALAELKDDPVFGLPDAFLEKMGLALMDSVSFGDLNVVARECWARFCKGTGGIFSHEKLTAKVEDHDKTKEYMQEWDAKFRKAILDSKCDLTNFTPLKMKGYAFESFWDKAGGLGIIVHDWWSIKAEIKGYTATWDNVANQGAFYGTIVYTLTDTFGLDWNDVVKLGPTNTPPAFPPPFTTGDRFKAWYILQHFRKAKHFFTQVILEHSFNDGAARKF